MKDGLKILRKARLALEAGTPRRTPTSTERLEKELTRLNRIVTRINKIRRQIKRERKFQ